jgi:hypothetical protein
MIEHVLCFFAPFSPFSPFTPLSPVSFVPSPACPSDFPDGFS